MKLLNYTTKKCQISPNLVKYCRKFSQKPGFFREIYSKISKKAFFSQNFDIFWQNPVSGPHKRHDGGQNFLIFQKIQNLSNFKNSKTPPEVKISEKNTPQGDNFGKKRTPEVKISEKNTPWWPKFELGPSIPPSLQPCCIAGIFLYSISLFHTFSLWRPPQGLVRLHDPY